jgi:hypothetical protein
MSIDKSKNDLMSIDKPNNDLMSIDKSNNDLVNINKSGNTNNSISEQNIYIFKFPKNKFVFNLCFDGNHVVFIYNKNNQSINLMS